VVVHITYHAVDGKYEFAIVDVTTLLGPNMERFGARASVLLVVSIPGGRTDVP